MASPPFTAQRVQISYNLSSLFDYLPSRLLKRWIAVPSNTNAMEHDYPPDPIPTPDFNSPSLQFGQQTRQTGHKIPPAFPGPLGFFTSGYMLGLFLMAVILHRIQYTIVPRYARRAWTRQPNVLQRPPTSYGYAMFIRHIFPLDFTSTATRLVFHLPTLYLLSRTLLLWILVVFQTSEISLPDVRAFDWLATWAESKEMSEVCWATFCAICLAFCVESLVRALDGHGTHTAAFGMGAGDNPNTSPFNLVGYAFLLHVYSSPSSHTYHPLADSSPSRPDKHVVITIAIPLIQLTLLHILSVFKRFSNHRLIPTALSSFLSLTHFHLTLLPHFFKLPFLSDTETSATNSNEQPSARRAHVQTKHFPLLNYVPNIFETLLMLSILLSFLLNLLIRILAGPEDSSQGNSRPRTRISEMHGRHFHRRNRRRRSRFSCSSFSSLLPQFVVDFFANLPYEEDFGVMLLRAGTRSLEEAAGTKGLGNEVAHIEQPGERIEYGKINLGKTDIAAMIPAMMTTTTAIEHNSTASQGIALKGKGPEGVGIRKRLITKTTTKILQGLRNEIRTVNSSPLPNADPSNSGGTTLMGFVKALFRCVGLDWQRIRAIAKFFWNMVLLVKGFITSMFQAVKAKVFGLKSEVVGVASTDMNTYAETRQFGRVPEGSDEIAYTRFLRGEELSSDDEDYAVHDSEFTETEDLTQGEDEESDFDETGDESRKDEVINLLFDLFFGGASTSSSSGTNDGAAMRDESRMVLRRLVDEHGPLTRERWRRLMACQSLEPSPNLGAGSGLDVLSEDSQVESWIERKRTMGAMRRDAESGEEGGESSTASTACVVCLTEQRVVICWPCRCLAMCDNCRQALASRSVPSKHRCPCCRRVVEGFSRIFIP